MSLQGKPIPHTNLLVYLSKAITKEQFDTMKSIVKAKEYGGFLAGELENVTSVKILLEKMEHKRVISVMTRPTETVDYRKLKEIIDGCENGDALNEIASAEAKLEELGYYVEREDAGWSSASAMETDPPFNVNNSHSDKNSGGGDSPDDFSYPKGRGYLLFINNFENSAQQQREGSEKDKENIEAVFEEENKDSGNLNFKCVFEKDLTKPELLRVLQRTREKLAKGNYSSFFLIISSHGKQFVVKDKDKEATFEGIATVDKMFISEEELTKPFLDQLKDKPKVFIIQACRAPSSDKADDMESTSMEDSTLASISKPVNADVLISYATSKGTKAWRNKEDGSWYISELCKGIRKYSKTMHLVDILVRVNHAIALMESTKDRAKQMPCQISTLTKNFWL